MHSSNGAMRALGRVFSDLSNLVRMGFSWNDSRRAFADAAMWFVHTVDLVGDRWSERTFHATSPAAAGPAVAARGREAFRKASLCSERLAPCFS
jgi:hypothetical protein